MVLFTLFASVASALFTLVATTPVDLGGLSPQARDIISRSTPAAPRFVVYSDKYVSYDSLPATTDLTGFNVFALSFLLPSGNGVDNAQVWASLTSDQRSSIKSEYNAAGISLIVSAFGSNENPTTGGYDPTALANTMAAWVQKYDLDGLDIDYEDFGAIETAGTAVAWLTTFTTQLRNRLPSGQYIITHAPVAPWFSPGLWPQNGYLGVHSAVGSLIDWYNVQFYNQGTTEYTTCSGLLDASSSTWPESALFQIAANGVTLDKLVIGKPATGSDASNGYMDPGTLASCLAQAKSEGWDAGAMVWQYPDAASSWIEAVRADSWPVSGSPPPPPTSTSTSTTSTTTSTGSGQCSGVGAWSSSTTYTSGQQVTYNGQLWTANQWNYDEVPGGSAGAWNDSGACNGAFKTASASTTKDNVSAKITPVSSASAQAKATAA